MAREPKMTILVREKDAQFLLKFVRTKTGLPKLTYADALTYFIKHRGE